MESKEKEGEGSEREEREREEIEERKEREKRQSADLKRYLPLKIATVIWLIALLGAEVYAIAATWSEWWPYSALTITSLDDAKPAIYSFLGGSIGATLYVIRWFYWAAGPQRKEIRRYNYDPSWIWWYTLRPLMGGFLGVLAYTAVKLGLATLGSTTSTGAGATSTYFIIAALAGFAATEFMDWFKNLAKKVFKSEEDDTTEGGENTGETEGVNERVQPPERKPTE